MLGWGFGLLRVSARFFGSLGLALAQGVAVPRYVAGCGASPAELESILHARGKGTLRSLALTTARGRISPFRRRKPAMANINNYRVFNDARALLRSIHELKQDKVFAGCGDLGNQIERAAISIASNIAEGVGLGSDRGLRKHLNIARGSAQEVYAQLLLATDIQRLRVDHPSISIANRLIARLTVFIQRLDAG